MDVGTEDEIARSWNANAGRWVRAVREGRIRSRTVATDQAMVDAVARHRPGLVADVGCGEGWLVRRLKADLGCRATGFDGSAELTAAAREADPDGNYRLLTYEAIAAAPPLPGGPYDVAVCNFALLGRDIAPLLAGIGLALRPNGMLIIQTIHPGTMPGLAEGWEVERFSGFASEGWQPMPWFFRPLPSWFSAIEAAELTVSASYEITDPEDGRALSLIIECTVDPDR
jgi:SAM-dependent methyltransferase